MFPHNGFISFPPVGVYSLLGEDILGGKVTFQVLCGLECCDKHWSDVGKRGARA